jgi:hypothetical protein
MIAHLSSSASFLEPTPIRKPSYKLPPLPQHISPTLSFMAISLVTHTFDDDAGAMSLHTCSFHLDSNEFLVLSKRVAVIA